jgi:hypothetical protein
MRSLSVTGPLACLCHHTFEDVVVKATGEERVVLRLLDDGRRSDDVASDPGARRDSGR